MPLILRPMVERDIPAWDQTAIAAFAHGLMPYLFPNGITAADDQHTYKSMMKSMGKPYLHRMVVVDTDLPPLDDPEVFARYGANEATTNGHTKPSKDGKVVGIAAWMLYDKDRTEEEIKAEEELNKEDGLPPSANASMFEDFYDAIKVCKKELMGGKANALLQLLAVHPDHHRRGIGAMHLNWGLTRADELDIPAYLEATWMGQPLYERWGFEPIRLMPFDSVKHGTPKQIDHWVMIRPAKSVRNQRSESV